MQLGLISDTHNNKTNIQLALTQLRSEGVSTILHAGDVTGVQALRLFAGFDLWIARGNMDHDPGLAYVAEELFGPGRLRPGHRLRFNGATIAITHNGGVASARQLVMSGGCDYVITGHSHKRYEERVGRTRTINPGALGSTRWHRPSYAVLDLDTANLRWFEL